VVWCADPCGRAGVPTDCRNLPHSTPDHKGISPRYFGRSTIAAAGSEAHQLDHQIGTQEPPGALPLACHTIKE
jgi:hypothetical protein